MSDGILDTALGALPLAGAIFDPIMQGVQNRKQRKWNEKMYRWQRTDALSDWQKQNEYNSPQAQMERLKSAGLNPNLVYGHGAEGNATGMPRASSAPSWSPKSPEFAGGSVLASYQNVQLQKAQLENLRTNNELMQMQKAKIAADTTKVGIDIGVKDYDLKFKQGLKQYYSDIVKWQANNLDVRNSQMQNQLAITSNYLQFVQPKEIQLLQTRIDQGEISIRKAAEEILTIQMNRTKIPLEKERLQQVIQQIKTGVGLTDVRTQAAKKDLYGGNLLPTVLKSILDKYLGRTYTRKY